MNSWLPFLTSKTFLKHLVLMFVAFVVFILVLFNWFDFYTLQGKSMTLNDLNKLSIDQAVELLESKGLDYKIVDSSSFNPEFLPLAVIQQDPAPESKVKKGRTIYLWLNASSPPQKAIPCLMGNASLDEAFDRFEQMGFKMGNIIYKPMDELKMGNPILQMYVGKKEIACGDKAPYGTKIDLVVGEKAGANKVAVPLLMGKSLAEAEFLLNSELNFGTIIYEAAGLIDTSSMIIYKQIPDFGEEDIRVGSTIDIWLIQDLPEEISIRIQQIKAAADSLKIEEE